MVACSVRMGNVYLVLFVFKFTDVWTLVPAQCVFTAVKCC